METVATFHLPSGIMEFPGILITFHLRMSVRPFCELKPSPAPPHWLGLVQIKMCFAALNILLTDDGTSDAEGRGTDRRRDGWRGGGVMRPPSVHPSPCVLNATSDPGTICRINL